MLWMIWIAKELWYTKYVPLYQDNMLNVLMYVYKGCQRQQKTIT